MIEVGREGDKGDERVDLEFELRAAFFGEYSVGLEGDDKVAC